MCNSSNTICSIFKTNYKTMADFVRRYNTKYANEYVAQPGASEHQTGLGIDLTSQSVVEGKKITFGDTDEYKWVVKNCAKLYTFLLEHLMFPWSSLNFDNQVLQVFRDQLNLVHNLPINKSHLVILMNINGL